jgi:mono/diheme cytochrome c family protein
VDGLKIKRGRLRAPWRALMVGVPLLQLTAAGPLSLRAQDNASGRTLYVQHCVKCHQGPVAQLAGDRRSVRSQPLNCGMISLMSDPTLFLIIDQGGAAAGLPGGMPAYAGKLGYGQIVDILHYLRDFCSAKGPQHTAAPEQASGAWAAQSAAASR